MPEELFRDAAVYMIPGQDFFLRPGSVRIEGRIQSAVSECFHPEVIPESFIPAVQNAAFLKGTFQNPAHSPVSSCKTGFQKTHIRLMPVKCYTFDIEDLP